jgi:hypothetical protein
MSTEENKAGRPKQPLDLHEYSETWYQEILDLYEEGGSDVEVKAMIYRWRGSFSNDLWDRWMIEEPEFSETIKTGRVLSQAWWTQAGRKNLKAANFSYTGWYMNMKNRFGWTDRVDNTSKGNEIKGNVINLGDGVKPEENDKN